MRLVTIIGTRPEIIKLSCIIKEADKFFDHVLIHTGQNYSHTLNGIFFQQMNIREPDYFLEVVDKNLGHTIGNVISKSYDILNELKPDCILILGDTNSCLATISAKRLKIPIFHMEAGNRCFDQNVPEEINRKLIDHISDINLPYTENSRINLINEGLPSGRIFVTGSPLTEVIDYYRSSIFNSNILDELEVKKDKYILLSIHREENIDIAENFSKVINSINALVKQFNLPIIFSTHPRTKKKIISDNIVLDPMIRSIDALGLFDYCYLQLNAFCVVSDSGTLSEESSILDFPAVSLRTSTERPEGIEAGSFIIGNINSIDLIESVHLATKMRRPNTGLPQSYRDTNVSEKIIKIIRSYSSIVKRETWKKD